MLGMLLLLLLLYGRVLREVVYRFTFSRRGENIADGKRARSSWTSNAMRGGRRSRNLIAVVSFIYLLAGIVVNAPATLGGPAYSFCRVSDPSRDKC